MSNYYKNGKCYKHIKHNKCESHYEVEFDTNAMDDALYKDNLDWSLYKPDIYKPEGGYTIVYVFNKEEEEEEEEDEEEMEACAEAEELGLCDSEDVESKDTEAHLKIIKDAMAVFKCGTCDNIGIYERKWTINGKSGIQRLCRECKEEDECAVLGEDIVVR
tara:strand:+ start:523 stop:1005 length:483 start_codon:yes stop_codon:yes gene_type:complete